MTGMTFRLDVTELAQYAERLEETAKEVQPAARKLTGQYANLIVKEAKRLVPVRTGNLRDSIRVTPSSEAGRLGLAAAGIAADAPYAGFVEFGTARMRPRPYIRPAVKRYEKEFLADMSKLGQATLGKGQLPGIFKRKTLSATLTPGRMFGRQQ